LYFRGGKYSGPWDHWSQKIFYAGRKKKGRKKLERGERKKRRERKNRRKRKERKIERKRATAPISSHAFCSGTSTRCRGCPQNNIRKNFDGGM
jgi:hypothetical protein